MKKAITSSLVIFLAFLCLCIGVFLGRSSVGERAMITYALVPAETDPPSDTAVNINTATVEELMTLPGVGEVLATRIITYRTENGPFKQIDELMLVDGIGLSTIDRFRHEITVGG